MMGRDHALLAGVVWVGCAPLWHPSLPVLAASTGVVAGAALLPDLDEPGSTVAHLAEPLTGVVAWVTGRLAGGHRVGTHSLLAVALAGLGTLALVHVPLAGHVSAAAIPLGILLALALRALLPRGVRPGHVAALVTAAGLTWLVATRSGSLAWLPPAVAAGWALHLAGDMLTSGGVPLAWPISHRHLAASVLGHTGSGREKVLAGILTAGLVVLAWHAGHLA